jgi:hypothetical protein
MTTSERRASENGIWLCQNCAKLVDSDVLRYTVRRLRAWRDEAEEVARIELATSGGATAGTRAGSSERVPDEWWERPGAPVFRLNPGSRRGAEEWSFQMEPEQIAGGDIGPLRYSYSIGGTRTDFRPAKLMRDRKWRLTDATFIPLGLPFEVSLRFWWDGAERTVTLRWEKENDFQNVFEKVVYS